MMAKAMITTDTKIPHTKRSGREVRSNLISLTTFQSIMLIHNI